LAIAGFALCLGLAATSSSSLPKRVVNRFPRLSLALVTMGLVAGSMFIVVDPTAGLGTRPFSGEANVTHVVIAASGLMLLATGAIHWQRWRLGGDRVHLGLPRGGSDKC
jgi:hypothetical protein